MKKLSHRVRTDKNVCPEQQRSFPAKKLEQKDSLLYNKPFYMKFSRLKTNLTLSHSNKTDSLVNEGVSDEMISKRVYTQAETNDLYASDFESSIETSHISQTVHEQIQHLQQSQASSKNQSSIPCDQADPYEFLTLSYLRRRNQQLISHIQYLRYALPEYKRNSALLENQRGEIKQLRAIRSRLIDYNYELELDKQNHQNTEIWKEEKRELRQCSAIFQKEKYKRVKQGDRKANPNVFQMQYQQVDVQARHFSMKRDNLVAHKKQFYAREQKLKIQQQKIDQYMKLLDMYDSILSKGSTQKLQTRKIYIQTQISQKQIMFCINQIELTMDITNLNNQIAFIQARLISISHQQTQIKEYIQQKKNQTQILSILTTRKPSKRIKSTSTRISTVSPKRKTEEKMVQSPKAIQKFVINWREKRGKNEVK